MAVVGIISRCSRLCFSQHCQVEPLCSFLESASIPRLTSLVHKLGTETMCLHLEQGQVFYFHRDSVQSLKYMPEKNDSDIL